MAQPVVKDIDRGWQRIKSQAARPVSIVAIGILASGDLRDDGESNVTIGASHEFGVEELGIPERSFIRATIDANRRDYVRLAGHLQGLIVDGSLAERQALGLLGARIVTDIQKRIQDGIAPELAESTILRKGSSKQLIDTTQMLNAIDWEVRT